MAAPAALTRAIEELWLAEEAADFPRLRRMPSTSVRKFLRYFGSLAADDREVLRSALISRGMMAFGAMPGALDGQTASRTVWPLWDVRPDCAPSSASVGSFAEAATFVRCAVDPGAPRPTVGARAIQSSADSVEGCHGLPGLVECY